MYPLSEQVSIQSRHFSPNQLKQIERRMNMKKFLASALSAALLLSALAGCSGSGSGSASGSAPTGSGAADGDKDV